MVVFVEQEVLGATVLKEEEEVWCGLVVGVIGCLEIAFFFVSSKIY